MSSKEPESHGGWVVDLRNPEALQRALESAGGMPPRKGRKRKDPTPTGSARPSAASADTSTEPADPSAELHEPLAADDPEATAGGAAQSESESEIEGDGGDAGDDRGSVRTTSGDLPSRSAATAAAAGASQLADDSSTDDESPDDGSTHDDGGERPPRRGDESMIAQAHVPVSLAQQRRRRQWALGGTAAVAVVACLLLVKGLSSSGSNNDGASLPDISVAAAPPSPATTPTSAAPTTAAGAPASTAAAVDPLADIDTIRNAPEQFGFYLDGQIVLQGTVPSKSKGADMKRAAGDLVGNNNVNAAYALDDTVATVAHPPLYIATPIRFDKSGNLDASSEAALKSAAELMIATPEARMAVLGFTGAQGSASTNLQLSKRKAEAVASELVRLGVPLNQLYVDGRGEDDPMGDNTTLAGRAANDRVELVAQGLLG